MLEGHFINDLGKEILALVFEAGQYLHPFYNISNETISFHRLDTEDGIGLDSRLAVPGGKVDGLVRAGAAAGAAARAVYEVLCCT